ncbi:hypothetical protein [Bremerella cremea]|uniref:hypothetical protein n=1 Tax=Bremerella cremea TaxID=1031537 RepID=UPI0031EFE537
MFRDKDYLLTNDGLIFNVLGDQHDDGHVTAGLKYAHGDKWLDSYADAVAFLQQSFPEYVDGRIRVPLNKVEKHLKPLERTRQLLNEPTPSNPRLALAIDLLHILADHCEVPSSEVGITDSLLWGDGNENSDIDLVIYGSEVVTRFLSTSHELFQFDDINHIEPEFVQRPPDIDDATFQMMLGRKENQGFYRGTRFSIRGVLTDQEVLWCPERTKPFQPEGPQQCELTISDREDSLLYPVGYETEEGISLVSYHIGYEMGLKPGDRVRVSGTLEKANNMQRLIVGSTGGSAESITIVPAS